MSTATKEFISLRSKEILKEIMALRRELAELRALKQRLDSKTVATKPQTKRHRRNTSGHTFQQMIVMVLKDMPGHSADANTILQRIYAKFSVKIERSSISPQLSRLKADGILKLDDNVWSLTNAGRKY